MGQVRGKLDVTGPLLKSILLAALVLVYVAPAHASGHDEVLLDANVLAQMELQAEHAQPREQCYMYTEVLHGLTELAGKQMRDGNEDQASTTMQHINDIAAKLAKTSGLDSKRLKNAEQLLEHTDRRLSDMAKAASGETRNVAEQALHQVDKVHTELLGMVFSH